MPAFASFRSRPALAAGMNITPLVDDMLVLLVVFMLAAPAAVNRLPLSNAPPCASCPPPESVRLSIKRSGEIYWDGRA
jgi:biopolymer transport protein ExbD